MKVKRAIFGGTLVAALLVLVLGAAGVFYDRPKPSEAIQQDGPAKPDHIEMRDIRIPYGDTVITAGRARFDPHGERVFIKPEIVMTNLSGPEGEQKTSIRARADEGYQDPRDQSIIHLKGNVQARAEGPHHGTAFGENFTWDTARRRGVMRSGVRLVLKGLNVFNTSASPKPAVASTASAESPVEIKCDGTLVYEAISRKTVLRDNVRVKQGRSSLLCDQLDIEFEKTGGAMDRLVALGKVRFDLHEEGVSGNGTRLVRVQKLGSVEVYGAPASVLARGVHIWSGHVVSAAHRLSTPGPGRLRMLPLEGSTERSAAITWRGHMLFDGANRRAEFERDVYFRDGTREVACERLDLQFAEDGRRLKVVKASQDVTFRDGDRKLTSKRLDLLLNHKSDRPQRMQAEGDVAYLDGAREMRSEKLDVRLNESGSEPEHLHATGGVALQEGSHSMTSNELDVQINPDGTGPRRMIAKGDVEMKTGQQRVRSDHLVTDFDDTGKVVRKVSAEKRVVFRDSGREVTSRRLEVILDKSGKHPERVVASGDVKYRDGEQRVACRALGVLMGPGAKPGEQARIYSVVAIGNVKFETAQGVGSGDKLTLSPGSGTMHLLGRPAVLNSPTQRFRGSEILIEGEGSLVSTNKPGTMQVSLAEKVDAKDQRRVYVAWQKRMRYAREEDRLLLYGNVTLTRENEILKGENVEIRPRAQLIRIRGAGSSRFSRPGEGKQKADTSEVTWTEGMDFSEKTREVVFQGKVAMDFEGYTIKADAVRAVFDDKQQAEKGVALGKVEVVDSEGRKATGDRMDWDVKADAARLSGSPRSPATLQQPGMRPIPAKWVRFTNSFRTIEMASPDRMREEEAPTRLGP